MAKRNYEIDMCSGPVLSKVLIFAFPLMLSTLLQLLFNAVDMIVVGRFSGSGALAAVGATGSLINFLVCIFIGISVGTNVLVARYYGAHDIKNLSEAVHTSVAISLIFGVFLAVLGLFVAPWLLVVMGTPADVLDQAVLYVRIYFVGMPVNILYNFGSAIMRAVGDTKRPLYFLTAAGVTNVVLNLIMVIVFHMGVAGVAVATVVSQALSAVLVLLCLMRSESIYRVSLKQVRVHTDKFLEILRIGLPAGLQSAMFSISNVLIQSSINSFGSAAVAGNVASSNIEGMAITTFSGAIYQADISFTSQNVGAKKYGRLNRITVTCLTLGIVGSFVLGIITLMLGRPLLSIYSTDAEVIGFGMRRMAIMALTYFLAALMDCTVGSLRGIGYSIQPMIVSVIGVCGVRVLWIFTVFAAFRTPEVLYMSYPITWGLTGLVHLGFFIFLRRKLPKEDQPQMT